MLEAVDLSTFENCDLLHKHGYSFNYYEEEKVFFIFGGLDFSREQGENNFEFSNDLIKCDLPKKCLQTLTVKGKLPKQRNFHTSIIWKKKLIIFGGKSNGYLNDVFQYSIDEGEWSQLFPIGDIPSKRYAHSAVCHKNSMYVYGGYDENSTRCLDIIELNLETLVWKQIKISFNDSPPGRYHHGCLLKGDSMIIFNGMGSKAKFNEIKDNFVTDLWEFNILDNSWNSISTLGQIPDVTSAFQFMFDENFLYTLGGNIQVGVPTSSFFYLNLKTMTWKKLSDIESPFAGSQLYYPRGALER
eukprot:gene8755-703_t